MMFWSAPAPTYPENIYTRTPTLFENRKYFSIPSTFTPTEFLLFVDLYPYIISALCRPITRLVSVPCSLFPIPCSLFPALLL